MGMGTYLTVLHKKGVYVHPFLSPFFFFSSIPTKISSSSDLTCTFLRSKIIIQTILCTEWVFCVNIYCVPYSRYVLSFPRTNGGPAWNMVVLGTVQKHGLVHGMFEYILHDEIGWMSWISSFTIYSNIPLTRIHAWLDDQNTTFFSVGG